MRVSFALTWYARVEFACICFALAISDLATARGGPRAASPGAAVSTQTRGQPYPRAARNLSLMRLLACHTFIALAVCPADSGRSSRVNERLAGCWTVRARANPLSLEVWHFTLRFVLHGVGLATPVDLERRAVADRTQSLPKVYPGGVGGVGGVEGVCLESEEEEEEFNQEEEEEFIQNHTGAGRDS
jgi:hypothetical protein